MKCDLSESFLVEGMLEETNVFMAAINTFTMCAANKHIPLGFGLCVSKAVSLIFQDKVFIYFGFILI